MRPLAVSMGDPAGIGLELIAKAARVSSNFFLIGDPDALVRAAERAQIAPPKLRLIDDPRDAMAGADLCVLPERLAVEEMPGRPDPRNAPAVRRAIERGVRACLARDAAALVTAPIAKATLYETGFAFPGHTEFIAALTKDAPWPHARGPVMMLACEGLRVALATIHQPLAQALSALSTQRIVEIGVVLIEALQRDFAIAQPRIALAGLNPHAGEGGTIGREEIDLINPAAAALRALGHDVRNAAPADTLFHAAARETYDAVIAMYHDQGLIPLKTIDFWGGVNVTLGLPIVRASPDHGTAFDIAGLGRARPESFLAALKMAEAIARRRATP